MRSLVAQARAQFAKETHTDESDEGAWFATAPDGAPGSVSTGVVRSRIPPGGFLSEMDEPLRLVDGSELPAAAPTDAASFEGFVIENQSRLFGSLCLITGSRHEAEEIAQEAFVRVLEHWDHVRKLDDPSGYLFVTSLNVYRKRLRRASLAVRRSIGVAPTPDAFGAVEDRELVLDALAQLPADQRRRSWRRRSSVTPQRRPDGCSARGHRRSGREPPGLATPFETRSVRNDDRRTRPPGTSAPPL